MHGARHEGMGEESAHVKSSVKGAARRPATVRVTTPASKRVAPAKKARGAATGAARGLKASASKAIARVKSRVVKSVLETKAAARTRREKAGAKRKKVARSGTARAARARRADPGAVLTRLSKAIPQPHVELVFRDPWQLLVAVILSAQSTDRRVNQVTPVLFERWPSPGALASAAPSEVEEVIKSTGFFRNKTKAIIGASAMLVERFEGRVPTRMDEMLELPGVARKTANVVLGGAHQVASGIVIDTHAARVAQRLGLTAANEPEKIEDDLCGLFPRSEWIRISHRLVLHGRYVCTARAPACSSCPLNELCPARLEPGLGEWLERAGREASEMEARAAGFVRV
jgi:endonuclease-3